MFIITGFIAGLLAGKILRGRGYGLIGNIIIGLIGAFVGDYLFTLMNLNASGWIGQLIMSTIGAIAFLWILSLFRR